AWASPGGDGKSEARSVRLVAIDVNDNQLSVASCQLSVASENCFLATDNWQLATLMPKRIAILGSTGSIGQNALEVIEHLGSEYRAAALSGRTRADLLLEQVRRHRPAAIAIAD